MTFSDRARVLAGAAGALLGWRPDHFWQATPAELATVFAALAPAGTAPVDATLLARMKEQFPDG